MVVHFRKNIKLIIFLFAIASMQSCHLFNKHLSEIQLASEVSLYPNCINDILGSCIIKSTTKNGIEPNLIAANIKGGVTIFGVSGTYTAPLSGPGIIMSNMYRDSITSQISILDESTADATLQYVTNDPGYRAIPDINKDDDGYTGGSVAYVDRSTWSTTACGTAQVGLVARIADCAVVFGANATWDGTVKGNSGQSVWKLVTRTGDKEPSGRGREVWQDQQTGLLWSSLVSGGDRSANWCKASGSNQIPGNPAAKDDPLDLCDLAGAGVYQSDSGLAISACFEDRGVHFTDTDVDLDPAGKANLNQSSSPKISWRLPTKYDQQLADNHGIRFVMPETGLNTLGWEWSASINSDDRTRAWSFNPYNGGFSHGDRPFGRAIRCVGR